MDRPPLPEASIRDHLANERTLLAWQRTALTVVGLGFLVDRFAVGGRSSAVGPLVGLAMVVLGGVVALVGAYRFVQTERDIETARYRGSIAIHMILTSAIVVGAIGLTVYLATSSP